MRLIIIFSLILPPPLRLRGEANLIVDNEVDRSTHSEVGEVRHGECLCYNALEIELNIVKEVFEYFGVS